MGRTDKQTLYGLTWDQLNGAYQQKEREVALLHRDNARLMKALARLQHCSHACLSPCPHTRKFNEVMDWLDPSSSAETEEGA